jgi:hypothetical protein
MQLTLQIRDKKGEQMPRVNRTLSALILTLVAWGALSAQEKPKEGIDVQAKIVQPYRLDFSLNEMEDGKILNSRHYSMNLTQGDGSRISIGTRVPVESGSSADSKNIEFQYIDVGTNIDSRLERIGEETKLHVTCVVSNIDATAGDRSEPKLGPVIRQIKIEGFSLLTIGKPIQVGSADDPNSKRQFQLEVTVTKLR